MNTQETLCLNLNDEPITLDDLSDKASRATLLATGISTIVTKRLEKALEAEEEELLLLILAALDKQTDLLAAITPVYEYPHMATSESLDGEVVRTSDEPSRPFIRISTATLPGLLQSYSLARNHLFMFHPMPERLKAALENPATKDEAIFLLRQGARGLNILENVKDGYHDLTETYLCNIIYDAYKRAERLGVAV